MNKNQELDRLWREICSKDREAASLAKDAANGINVKGWENAKKDLEALKKQYEDLKGGGSYNPLNLDQGERISKRSFTDKMLGRSGGDSHASVEKPR